MNYREQIAATALTLRSIAQNDHMIDGNYLPSAEALLTAASHYDSLVKDAGKNEALQAVGESAASSLAEMVAALECDYDRLEELDNILKSCAIDLENGDCAYSTVEMDDMRIEFGDLKAAAGDCESRDDAQERIQEDPLSVEVRSGWASNREEFTADEFCILLGTGGPATRIIGELRDNEPHRARLQVQDWFTPWTDYRGDAISSDDLLTYCRCFYFGE